MRWATALSLVAAVHALAPAPLRVRDGAVWPSALGVALENEAMRNLDSVLKTMRKAQLKKYNATRKLKKAAKKLMAAQRLAALTAPPKK